MKGHHKLDVWKRSIALVTNIYDLTRKFPKDETYGLSSQMRRAATSIPSNIAEGAGRNGRKEFIQFLSIAQGSLAELETQLMIAQNLKYIKDANDVLLELDEISRMIIGLRNKLRKNIV